MTQETKEQLEVLNQKKEDAFAKKQQIAQRIADKIKQISDFKKSRNDLTKNVRLLKVERDKLNTEITAKISEIKASQPKTEEKPVTMPTGPRGERLSVHELQRQIKLLEQKVETVPMSIEAEQKTMKQIKQFKKQLQQIMAVQGKSYENHAKSKEIDTLKASANALHAKVTQMAKQSQEHHEMLITLSKEIEDLKAQEDAAHKDFLDAKQSYVAMAGDVKEMQAEARAVRAQEKKEKDKAKKAKDAEDQKTLKQRAKEAEEKMMKGEKLTTEDLLALQSVKD